MNVVIPMAGLGKRFSDAGYDNPKPLINVLGKPMIQLAIESLGIEGNYIFIIRKSDNQENDSKIKRLLLQIKPNCSIIEIDYLTEGAACTCLLASYLIDTEQPLVIANCDQVMEWDSESFIEKTKRLDIDGVVVTYDANTPKNSYVKLNEAGYATEFAEKKVISNYSLNGIHYWKKGSDFVKSTNNMIENDIRVNNEFYIAPTYNELINEGKKIIIHHINKDQHHAVGTPEDLKKYENSKNGRDV